MKTISVALVAGVIAAACGADAPSGEIVSSANAAPAPDTTAVVFAGSPARRLARAKRVTWPLTFQGAGPLQPGMSLARAIIVMEGDLWTRDTYVRCSYFQAARAPGMKFLFLNKFLARIEVESGSIATAEGVKIGATEKQVEAAYPGRVTVTTDTYTNGHFLTVTPPDSVDSAFRIVFETDGQRVTRFRAGVRPAVDWAEGCS